MKMDDVVSGGMFWSAEDLRPHGGALIVTVIGLAYASRKAFENEDQAGKYADHRLIVQGSDKLISLKNKDNRRFMIDNFPGIGGLDPVENGPALPLQPFQIVLYTLPTEKGDGVRIRSNAAPAALGAPQGAAAAAAAVAIVADAGLQPVVVQQGAPLPATALGTLENPPALGTPENPASGMDADGVPF